MQVCGDRLGYVTVGESHRGYLGSGNVDWPQLVRALVNAGYDGPLVLETLTPHAAGPVLSNQLGLWREARRRGPPA